MDDFIGWFVCHSEPILLWFSLLMTISSYPIFALASISMAAEFITYDNDKHRYKALAMCAIFLLIALSLIACGLHFTFVCIENIWNYYTSSNKCYLD